MAYYYSRRKTSSQRAVSTPPPIERELPSAQSAKKEKQKLDEDPLPCMQKRIQVVFFLFFLFACYLLCSAAKIQLWDANSYTERIEANKKYNKMRAMASRPLRGEISDRNGVVLARNVSCKKVQIDIDAKSDSKTPDISRTAAILGAIMDMPAGEIENRIRYASARKRSRAVLKKVDDATAFRLTQAKNDPEKKAFLKCVEFIHDQTRVYPYKTIAGSLLGYVRDDGTPGGGLEILCDPILSGSVDSNEDDESQTAQRSTNVQLTIDVNIQSMAEENIERAVRENDAKWGGIVIVSVSSGDILGWAQYPSFNPNLPQPDFRNHIAQDALEPGSTFKPFLIASAMQEGIIHRDKIYYCEHGLWKTKNFPIRDDGRPLGEATVADILAYSSNIGCGKIGLDLGAVRYYRYLERLGFGRRTGLKIPGESSGIMRSAGKWSEADLISASFGQSISVTMAQMAQAYTVVANGGIYRPLRLIIDKNDTESQNEERIFSQYVSRETLKMMREVVDRGSGKRGAIPGVAVSGKTGTAQKAKRGKYGHARTASFVGIVPTQQPKLLIYVLIDEPSAVKYGGVIAAPVFRDTASEVMSYLGIMPEVEKTLDKAAKVRKRELSQSSSVEKIAGSVQGDVKIQPSAVPQQNGGIMPDVTGMSVRRAVEMLVRYGHVPLIKGSGTFIVKQSPNPGVMLSGGKNASPCTLWVSEQK